MVLQKLQDVQELKKESLSERKREREREKRERFFSI